MNLSQIVNSGSIRYGQDLAISAPKVLVAANAGFYALASTLATSVIMPAANTLGGARLFGLKNSGQFVFTVKDSAGNVLLRLEPGGFITLWASDITTPAGVWVTDTPQGLTFGADQPLSVLADLAIADMTYVSANKLLVVYRKTSTTAGMVVGTIGAGGDIAFGTEVSFLSGTALSQIALTRINTDKAIAVYNHGSGGGSYVVVSVVGTVPSLGTVLPSAGGLGAITGLAFSNTNKALLTQVSGAQTLSATGTTISVGTAIGYGPYLNFQIAPIGTDKFMLMNYDNGPLTNAAGVLTVSGTTITIAAGITMNMGAASTASYKLVPLGTDKALATWAHTEGLKASVLTAAGTVVTQGPVHTFEQGQTAVSVVGAGQLDTDQALVFGFGTGLGLVGRSLTASGTSLRVGVRYSMGVDFDPTMPVFGSGVQLVAGQMALLMNVRGTPGQYRLRLGGLPVIK